MGPSYLDLRTLAMGAGQYPASFLRGCGLSDWEIEAAKLYRPELSADQRTDIAYRMVQLQCGQPVQFYSVFISYCSANKSFARKLHDELQSRGVRCWLDEKQLKPGDRIVRAIDEGIIQYDKLVLCCSEAALETSWWVDTELEKLFDKEALYKRHLGKNLELLVPLDLDGHVFNWKGPNASRVRGRHISDFRGWDKDGFNWSTNLEYVITALRADEHRPALPRSMLPPLPG